MTATPSVTVDELAEYHQRHLACPECGSSHIRTTLRGCGIPDTNRAGCQGCGWVGTAHDLVADPATLRLSLPEIRFLQRMLGMIVDEERAWGHADESPAAPALAEMDRLFGEHRYHDLKPEERKP